MFGQGRRMLRGIARLPVLVLLALPMCAGLARPLPDLRDADLAGDRPSAAPAARGRAG
jgi:hypothetical protein